MTHDNVPAPGGGTWDPDLIAALVAALTAPGEKVDASSMTRTEMEAFILSRTVGSRS